MKNPMGRDGHKMKKVILAMIVAVIILAVGYYLFYRQTPTLNSVKSPPLESHGTDIRICMDTSMSMRGYFRTSKREGTTIQRFIWNGIIPVLKETYPSEIIYFSVFGNEIATPESVESLLSRFTFEKIDDLKSYFSATETRLVELFDTLKKSDYTAFIIITDGIPSVAGHAGPSPETLATIKNLIDSKKYFLWLIGIRSEFDGIIYPESPDKFGNRNSFPFSGIRPVYLWIGTDDRSKGKDVISKFLSSIEMLSSELQSVEVKFAELSFLDLPKAKLSFGETKNAFIVPSEVPLEIRVDKRHKVVEIPIQIDWQKESLKKDFEPSFRIEPPKKGFQIINNDNQWKFEVEPRYITKRPLTLFLSIKPIVQPWWKLWSASDDSMLENAGQTLYLDSLVGRFADPLLQQTYDIAKIPVRMKIK